MIFCEGSSCGIAIGMLLTIISLSAAAYFIYTYSHERTENSSVLSSLGYIVSSKSNVKDCDKNTEVGPCATSEINDLLMNGGAADRDFKGMNTKTGRTDNLRIVIDDQHRISVFKVDNNGNTTLLKIPQGKE
jgi:hypothetical protein